MNILHAAVVIATIVDTSLPEQCVPSNNVRLDKYYCIIFASEFKIYIPCLDFNKNSGHCVTITITTTAFS